MNTKPDTETGGIRKRSSSLDISLPELYALSARTTELVTKYFSQISRLPVFPPITGGDTIHSLGSDLPLEPEPLNKLFDECETIIDNSRHNGHPRFFAYVASPATPPGAFADLVASALNASVTSWRSAPAATEIEHTVVRWLGSIIGYGENAHGLLTSGGSMANLIAILIAQRSRDGGDPSRNGLWRNEKPMLVYASDQIHMSILKAADILGIGRNQVRTVETDDDFRMDVRSLRNAIQHDERNGLRPFCVVASAGTVNTGAVDPLSDIAKVADEFGLWFHVDGAYGAPAALDASKRELFTGLEHADSVSLDPHKWLYAPIDCGCLLFRDAAVARQAFSANEADYIKVHERTEDESFAFWDYGVELSRRFRALKVWFTLKYYGVRRLAEAITEDNALAQYFAARLRAAEDFELLAPVQLSICCFRYVPVGLRKKLNSVSAADADKVNGMIDDLNTRIMHTVQRGGQAYLSNATIRGRFSLRVCITNFRTTRSDIDQTLEVIRTAARELEG